MMRRSPQLLPLLLLLASPVNGQVVRYDVSVVRGQFHVSADFPTSGRDTLFVSLPAWSPGNYEIQNYARYVHGFGSKKGSWHVPPKCAFGCPRDGRLRRHSRARRMASIARAIITSSRTR